MEDSGMVILASDREYQPRHAFDRRREPTPIRIRVERRVTASCWYGPLHVAAAS